MSIYNMIETAYKNKKYNEVINLFNQYNNNNNNRNGVDAKILFIYSKTLLKFNKKNDAFKILNIIIKLDKNNNFAHLELGKLYVSQNKYENAINEFNKYIFIDKDKTPHAHLELGKLYVSQNKYEDAINEFNKCILIDKDRSPHAHLELGKLYASQNKYENAINEFNKCIFIDKDKNTHAHLELGKLYVSQNKYEDAINEFNKYILIDRDRSQHGYVELGRLYAILNNNELSEFYYGKAIKINGRLNHSTDNHYKNHLVNDIGRKMHSIFIMNENELLNIVKKAKKNIGYMCDYFYSYIPNCGIMGGYEGNNEKLDYALLITETNNIDAIITFFPCNKTYLIQKGIINEKNKKLVKN